MKRFATIAACLLFMSTASNAQDIIFTFSNAQTTGVSPNLVYEFDVNVHGNAGGFLGDGQVYLNYNDLGFGQNAAGAATVTKGALLDGEFFGNPTFDDLIVANNAPNRLAITYLYSWAGIQLAALPGAPGGQLLHVAIPIVDESQTSGLSFQSDLMDGQQFQHDNSAKFTPVNSAAVHDAPLDSALPVELAGFEAITNGHDALLQWTTASESDLAGFDVQHRAVSNAGSGWASTGFIAARGNGSTGANYTHGLQALEAGRHQFRLVMKDLDGTVTVSPILEVAIALNETVEIGRPFPNPFSTRADFTVAVAEAQHVTIAAYNLLGQKVRVLFDDELPADVSRSIRFDSDDLPAGMYLLRVVGDRFSETRSVVLTR